MSKLTVKIEIDQTEVNEAIEKMKELNNLIEKYNQLIDKHVENPVNLREFNFYTEDYIPECCKNCCNSSFSRVCNCTLPYQSNTRYLVCL
jgi:hypothetical protein